MLQFRTRSGQVVYLVPEREVAPDPMMQTDDAYEADPIPRTRPTARATEYAVPSQQARTTGPAKVAAAPVTARPSLVKATPELLYPTVTWVKQWSSADAVARLQFGDQILSYGGVPTGVRAATSGPSTNLDSLIRQKHLFRTQIIIWRNGHEIPSEFEPLGGDSATDFGFKYRIEPKRQAPEQHFRSGDINS